MAVGEPFPLASKRRRRPEEGEVEVFVADEQAAQPVDTGRWRRLALDVLDAQGIHGDAELSILFIDEIAIAELNERFMDENGPTDVLSFPLEEELGGHGRWPDGGTTGPDPSRSEPADPPLLLGDVVICPAVAARNAPEHAGTYDDEIALLVVHGILHVLGLDHADPEEEAKMQAREQELLARFHQHQ
jgi:probable rRNA maturation factor